MMPWLSCVCHGCHACAMVVMRVPWLSCVCHGCHAWAMYVSPCAVIKQLSIGTVMCCSVRCCTVLGVVSCAGFSVLSSCVVYLLCYDAVMPCCVYCSVCCAVLCCAVCCAVLCIRCAEPGP